mmetsp:Transcript_6732/g.23491  ORF Transcript_6732/g.23491 Transcript_6732/m.23491 type:complete len:394 (-) Transcript_6732:1714-2895(-)
MSTSSRTSTGRTSLPSAWKLLHATMFVGFGSSPGKTCTETRGRAGLRGCGVTVAGGQPRGRSVAGRDGSSHRASPILPIARGDHAGAAAGGARKARPPSLSALMIPSTCSTASATELSAIPCAFCGGPGSAFQRLKKSSAGRFRGVRNLEATTGRSSATWTACPPSVYDTCALGGSRDAPTHATSTITCSCCRAPTTEGTAPALTRSVGVGGTCSRTPSMLCSLLFPKNTWMRPKAPLYSAFTPSWRCGSSYSTPDSCAQSLLNHPSTLPRGCTATVASGTATITGPPSRSPIAPPKGSAACGGGAGASRPPRSSIGLAPGAMGGGGGGGCSGTSPSRSTVLSRSATPATPAGPPPPAAMAGGSAPPEIAAKDMTAPPPELPYELGPPYDPGP